MENATSEMIKIQHKESQNSKNSVSAPKLEKLDQKVDSDTESDIIFRIDHFDTPYPVISEKSRSLPIINKAQKINEYEEQDSKSEDENDNFRIPDTSQVSKVRAKSDHFVNRKNSLTKVSSGLINTTKCNSTEKKQSSIEKKVVKDGKSFDLTDSSVQNEKIIGSKEKDCIESKPNEPSLPPKLEDDMCLDEDFLKSGPNFD